MFERRALYNSLRVNYRIDPSLAVKPWQVADYRSYALDKIFHELQTHGINLDRAHFISFGEAVESPEELADQLIPESIEEQEIADYLFLLIFELWRRLLPEKQCLSIFCDELDYQIELYDAGQSLSTEGIEDAIANLQALLAENSDEGLDPHTIFESIMAGCAHDIEEFLYDYIDTQLEHQNTPYALDLIEGYLPYVLKSKWFELLHVKALLESDPEESRLLLNSLLKTAAKGHDLEFGFELLSFLAKCGEEKDFLQLFKQTIPLLEEEEDFCDLLLIAEDYFHFKDADDSEKIVKELYKERSRNAPDKPFSPKDPDFIKLQKLLT